MAKKKMPKLADLLNESIIVGTPAIPGTSPFRVRKDNFTFRGLPGRIKEDQKDQLTEEQKILDEDKFRSAFSNLIEASGINAEKMYDLLIQFNIDSRDAVNIAEALETAVLNQKK